MTDLTAEDRAALLAVSMACGHAREAVWRAYRKIMDVEVRLGKTAKDSEGNLLTKQLVEIGFGTADCCLLMHMAITDGRCVRWE